MDLVVVFLVPVGFGRHELFLEPPDDEEAQASAAPQGFWQRLLVRAHVRWNDAVRQARSDDLHAGVIARTRDRAIRATAEAVAEQRTLCDAVIKVSNDPDRARQAFQMYWQVEMAAQDGATGPLAPWS